jgi:hypothetical protein
MAKATVAKRLRNWDVTKIDFSRLSGIRCVNVVSDDGDEARINFEALSFKEGMIWHQDEGIKSFWVTIDRSCQEIYYAAEFCTCGGHAVAGKAPAWLFSSNPIDGIVEKRIPSLVRQRMNCVIGILAGEDDKAGTLKVWHEATETGWREEDVTWDEMQDAIDEP